MALQSIFSQSPGVLTFLLTDIHLFVLRRIKLTTLFIELHKYLLLLNTSHLAYPEPILYNEMPNYHSIQKSRFPLSQDKN